MIINTGDKYQEVSESNPLHVKVVGEIPLTVVAEVIDEFPATGLLYSGGQVTHDFTITNALEGDYAMISPLYDVQHAGFNVFVVTDSTVRVVLFNTSNTDLDLPAGNVKIIVMRS